MAQINVTQFAKELGLPPALLIEQLQAAGVTRALTAETSLTERDKTQLLDYLRQSHGAKESKQKITLTRKQTTEIKKSDGTGKSRTIQVEVRKKRVLVKRDAVETEPVEAPKVVLDDEQRALREAEAKQQAELAQHPAQAPAAAATAAPVEGTLHKPTTKPAGEKKTAKKPPKQVVWRDEAQKRRTIKTRGDSGGGFGWRTRKAGRHAPDREDGDQAHAFAAPTEPLVREIIVPETITVAD